MTTVTESRELAPFVDASMFELDQRRAKAYAESGYWPDATSIAKALVKIEAGRSLGIPAIVAMSEIHVIEGKPTLGAGALAALVKSHPHYDYRVVSLTDLQCTLRFYDRGQLAGESTFTKKDAETAKLLNRGPWQQYPRNMLFARAMSNGVAWFCPDVTSGRTFTPEELDPTAGAPVLPPEEADDADMTIDELVDLADPLPDNNDIIDFEAPR